MNCSKTVIKRDGREKEFSELRVLNAVSQAYASVYNGDTENYKDEINEITNNICKNVINYGRNRISIEKINDFMINELKNKNKEVAKSAINYRREREKARRSSEYAVYKDLMNAIRTDVSNENGNMLAFTPSGMMGKFASETSKTFTDSNLLREDILQAVNDNFIHIHDKDYYPTKSLTCLQHDLSKILKNGFQIGSHGSMRPAKRIGTASFMACMSMQTIQNEQHGGQSIPAFDYFMAPYVRLSFEENLEKYNEAIEVVVPEKLKEFFEFVKVLEYSRDENKMKYEIEFDKFADDTLEPGADVDDIRKLVKVAIKQTTKDTHQAMEAFVHNMNSIHSRQGNQVVFSSINYGTDTSAEGRCVIREILNSTYEGVGNGETAIFPIQIFKLKKGISYLPEDRNHDLLELAYKVTAKRFYPNYINLDATFNQNPLWKEDDPERWRYECCTMGCRTRVFDNRFGEKSAIGRGNLSFTTLNIVKMAILAMKEFPNDQEKRINKFFELLDKYCDLAADQLYERYKFQCTGLVSQFPTLMNGMWLDSEKLDPNGTVEPVIKHGTLSIGYIGLAECLIALTGHHHGESEEAQELGLKIVKHMRERCDEYCDKYDLNYSLLFTPAEGLSGKFTKKDKAEFGEIPGITDKDYYTNSNHVPVWYKCNATKKIEIEAPYHQYGNAGHILYVEFDGDVTKNVQVIPKVIDKMVECNAGYLNINTTRSRCLDCGFENTDKDLEICPKCGSHNIDTIQKITGYLIRIN